MNLRHFRSGIFIVFLALPLTGCLFRSRKVQQTLSTAPLKSASRDELVNYINTQAGRITSMQATVNIDTSVGGVKKGKIIDYQQIRGFVLARKPEMLRMIGLLPLVRTTAFDMVSNGQTFKLWIPPKNRFIEGQNNVETHNIAQPLENLRPQQIYDALLLPQIGSQHEIAVLQDDFETVLDSKGHSVQQPDYVLLLIEKGDNPYLSRKIIFSRADLLPHRQMIYNTDGELVTDANYQGYKDFSGVSFPSQIGIFRPEEEYDITLTILKLELNHPLPDNKFVLAQPNGAQVLHLDQPVPQSSEIRTPGDKGN
jgi:outer membrane lipoprotein-sorting protein